MIHYDQQFMIEKRRFRNPSLLSDGSISRPCIFSVSQNLLRQCIASVSQKIFCRDLWNVKLDGVPQRPPPTGGQFGPLGFRINSTSTFVIFCIRVDVSRVTSGYGGDITPLSQVRLTPKNGGYISVA